MDNSRRTNRFYAALVVVVIAAMVVAFAVHRNLDRTVAQPSRDLSKMISVRLMAAEALSAHYQQQGSFPSLLSELPLQSLYWGDEGSSARDLDSWRYSSDGRSFTMTWTNGRGAELFLGGQDWPIVSFRARNAMRTPPNISIYPGHRRK